MFSYNNIISYSEYSVGGFGLAAAARCTTDTHIIQSRLLYILY